MSRAHSRSSGSERLQKLLGYFSNNSHSSNEREILTTTEQNPQRTSDLTFA